MIQGSDVGALARSGVRVAGWQANFERAHGIEDELIVLRGVHRRGRLRTRTTTVGLGGLREALAVHFSASIVVCS